MIPFLHIPILSAQWICGCHCYAMALTAKLESSRISTWSVALNQVGTLKRQVPSGTSCIQMTHMASQASSQQCEVQKFLARVILLKLFELLGRQVGRKK